MEETRKKGVQIFSTRSYPTFGRSRKPFDELNPPATVTRSPYYWWFMFLRLNADYKATCEAGGKGKYADLYRDLGDVHSCDFKQWWTERVHLFAEPKKGYRMLIAKSMSDIAPFDSDEVLNLVVPLTRSRRSLQKTFTRLVLRLVEKGKPGVSVEKSEAAYKLSGKWNAEALAHAHRVYQIKHSVNTGKKLAWADIGIRAELPYAKRERAKEGVKTDATVDIRATLTVLAHRHYMRAVTFIESAASHSYPYKIIKK